MPAGQPARRRRYTAISGVASTRLRVYGMLRLLRDLPRIAHLNQPSAIHHRNTRGEIAHHRHGVRDKEIGQAKLALQLRQQVDDLRSHADVERRNRLIRDDELRTQRQRPRDPDALPLSSAEFVRKAGQDRRSRPTAPSNSDTRARRAVRLIAS